MRFLNGNKRKDSSESLTIKASVTSSVFETPKFIPAAPCKEFKRNILARSNTETELYKLINS